MLGNINQYGSDGHNKIIMRHASLSTAQVFDSSDMESMTREERRFAEEQLRNIFSRK